MAARTACTRETGSVYDNLTEKLQLFSKFEVARESLLGMVSAGTGIVEIMRNKRLQQPVA